MTSRSSNNEITDPDAMDISEPFQQAKDDSEMVSAESGLAANVLSVSDLAGPSSSGSNVPSTSTSTPIFLPAPASATRPTTVTTQSAAHQEQLQSQESREITYQHSSSSYDIRQRYNLLLKVITGLIIKDWVPSNLSPAQVQHYLLDTRNQIQTIFDLEAQIKQLKPALSLHLDRELFTARVDYQVRFARIFRINDLPPEILTLIFQCIIAELLPGDPEHARCRLRLTWVCRLWREIALSDPTIWNIICISDPSNFERSFAWIERSGNTPLHIRIRDTPQRPMSFDEMEILLERLFNKISNIRIIIMLLHDFNTILFVLRAFCVVQERNPPMILDRFEIHRRRSDVQIEADDDDDEHPPLKFLQPIPLFGGATVPSLNQLSLDGVHIDWENSVLTNLTVIDLQQILPNTWPTLSQFRALLDGSPALRVLIMAGAGPTWVEEEALREMKPIQIPSLRALTLGNFDLDYALYISGLISAPNVLDLTMIDFVEGDYARLYAFLTLRMPLVKILSLHNIDFVPNLHPGWGVSIVKWLQSMPQITFLRIGTINPGLFELFLYDCNTMTSLADAPTPLKHILCPKLAFLEIYFGVEKFEIDGIARWAGIRRRLGSPLQAIYIRGPAGHLLGRYRPFEIAMGRGGTVHLVIPGTQPGVIPELMREIIQ